MPDVSLLNHHVNLTKYELCNQLTVNKQKDEQQVRIMTSPPNADYPFIR